MAINDSSTRAPGNAIWAAIKGALSIFSNLNKADFDKRDNTDPIPETEYEDSYNEVELLSLVSEWKRTYSPYYKSIEPSQDQAYKYWIGDHAGTADAIAGDGSPVVDNLIFEAVETFLPIAGRANPDPLVTADPTPNGQFVSSAVKSLLVSEADRQKLRMKLKKTARTWLIQRIGVIKIVWDPTTQQIDTQVLQSKRMIFDKDGYIDESGRFVGEFTGERKKWTADKIVEVFPKKKAAIEQKVNNKMATKLEVIEWWHRDVDTFYTCDDMVLWKGKNHNWNYDGEIEVKDPETGEPRKVFVQGRNHFDKPYAPYLFLGIFNTGIQPHDDTGLILQNISSQDMVNRRWRQIERNIEGMNNGLVVSGKAFTHEQAAQAASALRRGQAIRVPDPTGGAVTNDVARFPANGLPADVFASLRDARGELKNIFGTSGSTPSGISSEETVRGKIMVSQMDSSRIGGGVTEYIEQLADSVYNWWIQMMFVHWSDEQFVTVLGESGAMELKSIRSSDLASVRSLHVTVKEGSMIPKDPLTQRNEAIDLWSANAIDPRSLYKKLDFPDPDESTKQLILWQMLQKGAIPPQAYLPGFAIPQQGQPPLEQKGVGDEDVNPLGPPTPPAAPEPGTGAAEEQQAHQLIESVPIK